MEFTCEICGCKTPIECEGAEQNVCADCLPNDELEKCEKTVDYDD